MEQRKTTMADLCKEESMPMCSCNLMRATLFCNRIPKCNSGQAYYCIDLCSEQHDHKNILITKATQQLSKDWSTLFEDIDLVFERAKSRYDRYEELIVYCEEVNGELDPQYQYKENTLFQDFEKLKDLYSTS